MAECEKKGVSMALSHQKTKEVKECEYDISVIITRASLLKAAEVRFARRPSRYQWEQL